MLSIQIISRSYDIINLDFFVAFGSEKLQHLQWLLWQHGMGGWHNLQILQIQEKWTRADESVKTGTWKTSFSDLRQFVWSWIQPTAQTWNWEWTHSSGSEHSRQVNIEMLIVPIMASLFSIIADHVSLLWSGQWVRLMSQRRGTP